MLIKKHSATDLIWFYPFRYWGWNNSVKSSQCHNCWWPESSLPGVIIGNVLKLCNKRILSLTGDDFQLPASSQCRQPCWCHQMETFSALLVLCVGNSPVTGEFPAQSPVTRSFDVSLICALINPWVNNRGAADLRRHRAHYDVNVMCLLHFISWRSTVTPRSRFFLFFFLINHNNHLSVQPVATWMWPMVVYRNLENNNKFLCEIWIQLQTFPVTKICL